MTTCTLQLDSIGTLWAGGKTPQADWEARPPSLPWDMCLSRPWQPKLQGTAGKVQRQGL